MTTKRMLVQIAPVILALLTGCMEKKQKPQPTDLLGNWKSSTIQTEWGAAVMEVCFQSSSDIEFKMTPVEGGQSLVSKGKYRLSGRQLVSDAINKGEPVCISLEGKELLIQTPLEQPQRFTRK